MEHHEQQRDPANELRCNLAEAEAFTAWVQEPDGYHVFCGSDGKYGWESILAPSEHRCSGFQTYEEALTHCREAQLPHDQYR